MENKERIKKLKQVGELIGRIYSASVELSRIWQEDSEITETLENGYYPFGQSFDEVVCELSEWKDEADAQIENRLKKFESEDTPFYLTMEVIRQTVGFDDFCEVTGQRYELEDDEFDSNESFKITKKQARELGFPVK